MQEAIALLATAANDLAMERIRRLAYAILDGTLIPIDGVADQKPFYSGRRGYKWLIQSGSCPVAAQLRR